MEVTIELVAGQKHQQRIKSSSIEVQGQNAVPDNAWESQGLDPWRAWWFLFRSSRINHKGQVPSD